MPWCSWTTRSPGWRSEKLWIRSRLLDFLGRYSLEIYLLNVSVFSLIGLWRGCLPFGGSNRLYYVIMLPLNVLLAVLLRRIVAAAQSFCHFHRDQISRSVKRRH